MAFVDQLNATAPAGQNYVATGSGFQLVPKGGTPPPSVPPIPPSAGSNANPTIPTGTPSTIPNKEPTALYSGNVQDKYQPALQAKLDAYKNTGHIVGEDNVVRDSTGNLVPAPQNTNPDQNGQYTVGGFIYGPPAKITGQNFDQEAFDRNINLFNQVKAQTDATTKAVLDNITDRYQTLIQQVQDNNMRSQKGLEQSLLMSGSLRYSAGSEGQIHELANQGILKIAQLENEKQSAILAAQQAADENDWKTVDRIIAQSDKTKTESLTAAKTVSDQLAKHYQDLIDAQTQSGKDTAVARQLSNGVVDPLEILKNLQAAGNSNITAKDIESTLANLSPDAKEIASLLKTATGNGLTDPATIHAIASARNLDEAYKAAGNYASSNEKGTIGEYNLAKRQGFVGSILDYQRAVQQIKKPVGGTAGSLSGLPQGFQSAAQKGATGSALLGSLSPADKATVQALLDYTKNPANLSLRKSAGESKSEREKFLSTAHLIDPTYDESQYAARSTYNKNLQSGTIYQGLQAAGKSINHLTSLLSAMNDIGNGNIASSVNAGVKSVEKIGNPSLQKAVKTAQIEATGVSQELAKFFKGTGVSDVESINDWKNNLSIYATPGEQEGIKKGALTLLTGQLDVVYDQYRNTMGKNPDHPLVPQETLDKLKGLGVDVSNYEGVNPTVSAVVKNQANEPTFNGITLPSPTSKNAYNGIVLPN